MSLPEPPVNVRLVYADDTEIPVDTVYVGVDEEGDHVWRVLDPPNPAEIVQLRIDELPSHTAVQVGLVAP
jgi:hypothetical protein